jgi:hypothetical protein
VKPLLPEDRRVRHVKVIAYLARAGAGVRPSGRGSVWRSYGLLEEMSCRLSASQVGLRADFEVSQYIVHVILQHSPFAHVCCEEHDDRLQHLSSVFLW